MKAKLIVNNKEIEVEISEEELNKLKNSSQIKTGYERLYNEDYFIDNSYGDVEKNFDGEFDYGWEHYGTANYYSDYTVAESNIRADKLMRQLRRFAVEHRKEEFNWDNCNKRAYYICYDHINGCLNVAGINTYQTYGVIYFDMEDTAQFAIRTFHDELIWYFTEYKDSL